MKEFLLWLSRLRTQHCLCEDAGSMPWLAQWGKDLALPQAAVQVADVVQIWHCCGCGEALSRSSNLTPSLETSICCRRRLKKKKKIKRKGVSLYSAFPPFQVPSFSAYPQMNIFQYFCIFDQKKKWVTSTAGVKKLLQ